MITYNINPVADIYHCIDFTDIIKTYYLFSLSVFIYPKRIFKFAIYCDSRFYWWRKFVTISIWSHLVSN